MRSKFWVRMGLVVIAVAPSVTSFAGSTTIDTGYTVDPCYKRCVPLLSNVSPKSEAKRVYDNCSAYCKHKGLIQCPDGALVKQNQTCP